MKKILVLLMVIAIAMGSVFAAPGTGSWTGDEIGEGGESATLGVKLQLNSMDIFTIGFTDEAEVNAGNIDSVTPKTELILSPEGSEYTGTTNIYYGVKNLGEGTYKIGITIGNDLTAGSGTDIPWEASAASANVSSQGTKSGDVWTSVGSTQEYEVNYTQLAISTDGFVGLSDLNTKDAYEGTITLTIASN